MKVTRIYRPARPSRPPLTLAACGGGGAPTTATAGRRHPPAVSNAYTGPPPASADVQAFEANLLGQHSRAATAAATATRPVVSHRPLPADRQHQQRLSGRRSRSWICRSPSNSLMVKQVANGHNCWLASNQSLRRPS